MQQHIKAIMKNGVIEFKANLRLLCFCLDVFDTGCFIFLFLIYLPPFYIGVGVGTCFPISPDNYRDETFSWLPVGH